MKINQIKTLEQFRKIAPESTKSDDALAEYFFTEQKEEGVTRDNYYDYVKKFNPESPLVSMENLKEADLEKFADGRFKDSFSEKDNIQKTNDILEYIQSVDPSFTPTFKSFLNDTYDKRTSMQAKPGVAPGDEFMPVGYEDLEDPYDEFEIAKSFGVEVNPKPEVAAARKAQSFAENEEQGVAYLAKSLKEVFGEDIQLRTGPKTDALEFYNPNKDQWSLINPEGADMSDFSRFAGDAIVVLPDLVASTVAFIYTPAELTGRIAAASITSGATVPVADGVRLMIGDYLYGSQTVDGAISAFKKRYGEDKFSEFSAVLTAGGFAIGPILSWAGRTSKRLSNKVVGSKFKTTPDSSDYLNNSEIESLMVKNANTQLAVENLAKIRAAQDKMNIKNKLHYTIATASDDPEKLIAQKSFEQNAEYGVRTSGGVNDTGLLGFKKDNAESLAEYFKLSEKPFHKRSSYDKSASVEAEELGSYINKIIIKSQSPARKAAVKAEVDAGRKLTNEVIKFKNGQEKVLGQKIRTNLETVDDVAQEEFKKRYQKLFEAGGGRTINTNLIAKAADKILKDAADSPVVSKELDSKLKLYMFGPDETLTMKQAHDTLSKLLSVGRYIKKGGPDDIPGYPSEILKAFNKQIEKDIGLDDIFYTKYLKTGEDYKYYLKNKASVINSVMKIDSFSVLKLGDEKVFETTFLKNNQRNVDNIYDILKEKPTYLKNYKKSIENFYRNFVDPTGSKVFDSAKHSQFMKDYGGYVKKFFDKDGVNKFTTIKELDNVFKKNTKKNTELKKTLDKSPLGRLIKNTDASPENVIKVYDSAQVATLREMVKLVSNEGPATLKRLQTVVAQNLRNKSMNKMDDTINLEKFVENFAKEESRLKIVFANQPEYLFNLKNLKNSLKILGRKAPPGNTGLMENIGTTIDTFIKVRLAPPLSTRGRLYTGIKRGLGLAHSNRVAQILLDPDLLKTFNQFVEIGNKMQVQKRIFRKDKPISFKNPVNKKFYTQKRRPTTALATKFKRLAQLLFGSYIKEEYDHGLNRGDNDVEENIELYRDTKGMDLSSLPSNSNKLSQAPINVATLENEVPVNQDVATPPSQGPVNPQGIAALPTDQGPRATGSTNTATLDKMKDYDMKFLA